MKSTPETRDLAQQLLAYETRAGNDSGSSDSASLRVYEKLRGNLCTLVGIAGFQSLASRALALASLQVPGLRAVQVAPDGKLQGICKLDPSLEADDSFDQAGIILISCLIELLHMFLGKALTMNLVRNVWSDPAFGMGNPHDGRKA